MKPLLLTLIVLFSAASSADSLLDDANSLGGNKELINKARAIDPNNRVRIVQNRLVDRNYRLELGVNYGAFSGGDPYVNTDQLGGSVDFHVNPLISVGFRYFNHSNSLSDEGERRIREAEAARAIGLDPGRQAIDFLTDSYMGVINIYPTYGKMNLFDITVAQFDFYLLGGVGTVNLESGAGAGAYSSTTYTAGAGLGLWMSKRFSTRFEARYQTYEDRAIANEPRNLDLTVFSASLGVFL